MKLIYNSCIALLFLGVLSISNLSAQEGRVIPFQGTLYQGGTAVNGTVNITFTIAEPAWTETHDNVSVTQGVYAVVLGETTPFPDDMFTTGSSPDLVVNIGGSDVATVALHAPFISEAIVDDNMPGQINRTFDEDGTEFNGLSMVVDGSGNAQTSAFEGVAQTDTQNTGVEGFAVSGAGNTDVQYGLYGQATGDGTGTHRGVMGYGAGGGKYNHGLKGVSEGTGDGSEGYGFGEGSINFGVEGNSGGNAWNNTGVEGSNFGTEGVTNFGVHGISKAGTGVDVENFGVSGNAFGPGKNYGVYGLAGDGQENWAGYFEGDVNVNGELLINGQALSINPNGSADVGDTISITNQSGDERVRISNFEQNDAGFLETRGRNDSLKVLIGSANNGYDGYFEMYDSTGVQTHEMRSNASGGHFFMYNENTLNSNGNGFRYPSFWMKNYNYGTYFQMVGVPEQDDPNWEKLGEAYIQAHGSGATFTLGAGNEGKVRARAAEDYGQLNIYGNEWKSSLQMGGKFWEGRSDLGYIAVYGSPDTLDMIMMQAVEVDGGANEMGQIILNGTDGSSFTIDSHGIQSGSQEHRAYNGDGDLRAELGYFDTNDAGYVEIFGANDSTKSILGTTGGGYGSGLWLYDSLRHLGAQLRVTNNGRGRLSTYNDQQKNTGWFGDYNNTGFMQILDYDDTGDVLEGGILAGFWAGHPELYMELDNGQHMLDMGIQDSAGYFWIRGRDTQNIEMGSKNWEDEGKNLPFFKMVGNDDSQDLLWMEVQRSAEGEEYGYLSLNGTDGHVATYGAREFELRNDNGNGAGMRVDIMHDSDNNDPFGYAANINLSGTNGDNIQLGAKGWETNGHDLPYIVMRGSADVDDGGGNFYRPDLVWMEAQRWGDGTEIGSLRFSGTDGSSFTIDSHGIGKSANGVFGTETNDYVNIGAKDWEGNNGDQRGFIHLSGTDDGNGDTQRIYLDVDDYGDGSFGVIGLKNYQDDGGGNSSTTVTLNGENGNIWTKRAAIQSDWGTEGQGALELRDANDNTQIRASVNDDGSGNYNGYLELSDNLGNGSRMGISSGGINIGESAYSDGVVINYDNSGGGVFEMYGGNTLQAFINGSNGDASFQGEVFANSLNSGGVAYLGNADDGNGTYGNMNLYSPGGSDNRISMGFADTGSNAGFMSLWYDNGGGTDEYGLMNVVTGGPGGAVFGSLFLKDDLGNSVSLNGYGDISASGTVNADTVDANILRSTSGTVATSDARFKKNVKSIDGALAKTQQLNGYTYNWNKLAKKEKGIESKEEQVGVLAQELEAVFPQLVKTDDEGYKAVNYAALTAVLIEAVKELSEQVTHLQGENAELKAELTKVDELEIKIDLIQKLLAKKAMIENEATASR